MTSNSSNSSRVCVPSPCHSLLPPLTSSLLSLQQLVLAAAARHEVVLTTDGLREAAADLLADEDDLVSEEARIRAEASRLKGPSVEAKALFSPHNIDFGEEAERREQATVNAHFKLLMRLLEWESTESEPFPFPLPLFRLVF